MIITFNELRRIKDRPPSGNPRNGLQTNWESRSIRFVIISADGTPRSKEGVGIHIEQGPDGGVVTLDDTTILDAAMRILNEKIGSESPIMVPRLQRPGFSVAFRIVVRIGGRQAAK